MGMKQMTGLVLTSGTLGSVLMDCDAWVPRYWPKSCRGDVHKYQRWFSKFRSGNFYLSDSHRSGRPTTLDNDVIKGTIESKSVSDNRRTVKCSYNQPRSTIQELLQHIDKTNIVGIWVPHNLLKENRANRSTTCNLLLQRYNTEPFFDRLITADEKWVLYDNPKRKRQ
ncbi:histone-lysine N-methyltransferase SETMAR [Trichonephila clavipes]|nr:histone-lysine N-methyltransferase SETMAR [Trichonephila clavipes]